MENDIKESITDLLIRHRLYESSDGSIDQLEAVDVDSIADEITGVVLFYLEEEAFK